jgi:hypothetical protein
MSPGLAEAAGAVPLGPFLLLKGEAYFVHGNSYVKLQKGGMDYSANFNTWRRWRMWTVDCDAGIPGSGKDPSEWIDDNQSGGPNWRDIPGEIFTALPPQWDRACTLSEFVVAVAGHEQRYGALYFFVLFSVKQSEYRVQMSSAKALPFSEWTKLQSRKQPWALASGVTIKVDSGWKRIAE